MIIQIRGTSGVYAIENSVNSKVYVGSATKCIRSRWYLHLAALRKGKHHSRHLQAAWNKYGEPAFSIRVLEVCLAYGCIKSEQYWIDKFQAANNKFGYNVSPTAGNSLGCKRTKSTRKKLSDFMKRPGVLAKLLASSTTPEALLARSIAQKGRTVSKEHRRKISKTLTGRKVPRDIVEKSASKRRGKPRPESFCKKMQVSMLGNNNGSGKLGKKYGPNINYQNDEEAKARKSESARLSWVNRRRKKCL